MKLKALSLWQPWAWLMIYLPENIRKDVENRSWYSNHRGLLLIHAAKTFDHEGYKWVKEHFPDIAMPQISEFQTGGIVGSVEVTDCVTHHPSQWFFGPHALVCKNAKKLPFFRCPGRQRFFEVDLPVEQDEQSTQPTHPDLFAPDNPAERK